MTFSALASGTAPAHGKYSSRYGNIPQYMIVHQWAGTTGGDGRLVDPNQVVSCTYILYTTGALIGQVPEEYRPWTSGSPAADNPAITVETQNTGGRFPGADDNDYRSWPVSDKALEMLAQLAADLCRRYGWGKLDRTRVRGHREFDSTACPGGYLWARLDWIIKRGNQILAGDSEKEEEQGDIEMRTIYNTDDTNEDTRRAAVGEFTFQVQRSAVNTRERKLWGAPVNVTQGEWDAILATVNTRRKMVGLEPLKGTYNEFYNPAGGDKK